MRRQVLFFSNKFKNISEIRSLKHFRKFKESKIINRFSNNEKRNKKQNYLVQYFIEHIKRNIKEYLILFLVFLIGICLGIVVVNNIQIDKQEIIKNYILKFIEAIKTEYKINTQALLKTTLINNCSTVILLWFIGSTIIGLPLLYLIIGYKGFCIGYTICSIIGSMGKLKGILFVLSSIFLQNIIYIPVLIITSVSGLKVYKVIIKNKQRENIKIELLRHTLLSLLMLLIIMLASLIESYVSVGLVNLIISFL